MYPRGARGSSSSRGPHRGEGTQRPQDGAVGPRRPGGRRGAAGGSGRSPRSGLPAGTIPPLLAATAGLGH